MPRWFVKDHACDRFRERIDRRLTKEQVRDVLTDALKHRSAKLRTPTMSGEDRYLLERPNCIAVVARPRDVWDDVYTVVTVYDARDNVGVNWNDRGLPESPLGYKEEHHPDWDELREEYKQAFGFALLRASTRANVQGAVKAWMRMQ